MNTLRRIVIGISIPALSFVLFSLVITAAIVAYFGTPKPLKQTLVEAKVYDYVVSSIIDQVQTDQQNKSEGDISLDNPAVQNAANQVFTPQFVQESAENIIDGTYSWLDGKTQEPEFTIDLGVKQQGFVEQVANAAVERVNALPVCTSVEQAGNTDDPFSVACKPPDFDPAAEKQAFIAKANQTLDSGENQTISPDTITKESGKPLSEQLAIAKTTYSISKIAPYILGVLALLLSALVFVLHDDKAKAIFRLSGVYIMSGVAILLLLIIMWFALGKATFSGINDVGLAQSLTLAIRSIYETVRNTLLVGGGLYAVIGVGGWIFAKRMSSPLTEAQKQNNINSVMRTKELSDKDAVSLDEKSPEITDNKSTEETSKKE